MMTMYDIINYMHGSKYYGARCILADKLKQILQIIHADLSDYSDDTIEQERYRNNHVDALVSELQGLITMFNACYPDDRMTPSERNKMMIIIIKIRIKAHREV